MDVDIVNNVFVVEVSKDLLEYDHLKNTIFFENLVQNMMNFIGYLKEIESKSPYRCSLHLVLHHKQDARWLTKILQNIYVGSISKDFMEQYLYISISRLIKDFIILQSTTRNQKDPEKHLDEPERADHAGNLSKRPQGGSNSFINLYNYLLKEYHGRKRVIYLMNFRGKPALVKDDGIYKIVDDFTKVKVFEIDCAPAMKHYRISQGNIRYDNPANKKLLRELNGSAMDIDDITEATMLKNLSFSSITSRTSSIEILKQSVGVDAAGPTMLQIVNSSKRKAYFSTAFGYPRTLVVYDMQIIINLRLSSGWRMSEETDKDNIYFTFDMFDVCLLYQLKRIDHLKDEDKDVFGYFEVNLFCPLNMKETKRGICEVVRSEARVWDDNAYFCEKIRRMEDPEVLKKFIFENKARVNDLLEKIKDQKSTK